jgi:hypothetical protein
MFLDQLDVTLQRQSKLCFVTYMSNIDDLAVNVGARDGSDGSFGTLKVVHHDETETTRILCSCQRPLESTRRRRNARVWGSVMTLAF